MSDVFYPTLVRDLPQDDGGGFIAFVLDLPGCISDGDTPEEALANARLAALEWIDEVVRLGKEVPEPNSFVTASRPDRASAAVTIEKQQNLIRAQEELIEAHEKTIASLTAQISALNEKGVGDFEQPHTWGSLVRSVGVPAGVLLNHAKDLQH